MAHAIAPTPRDAEPAEPEWTRHLGAPVFDAGTSNVVETVYFGLDGPLTSRHGRFVQRAYPFKFQSGYTGADTYFLQNLLVTEANMLFKDGYYTKVSGPFLTRNGLSAWFASSYSPHCCALAVADSIPSAVGSANVGTTTRPRAKR